MALSSRNEEKQLSQEALQQAAIEAKEAKIKADAKALEKKHWQGLKTALVNTPAFIAAGSIPFITALYQTFTTVSKSNKDITDTFNKIMDALKQIPGIKDQLAKVTLALAQNTKEGIAEATAILNSISSQAESLLKEESLADKAQELLTAFLEAMNNNNTLRETAFATPAIIFGVFLLFDYLEQIKNSWDPSNRMHFAVGGIGVGLGTAILQVLRGVKCFGENYLAAEQGFACSQAENDVSRAVNNILIQVGFLFGATAIMRFVNSCFKNGTKNTLGYIGTAVINSPWDAAAGAQKGWTRLRLWVKPGDKVTVEGAAEGQAPVVVTVDSAGQASSKKASAPTLDLTKEGATGGDTIREPLLADQQSLVSPRSPGRRA